MHSLTTMASPTTAAALRIRPRPFSLSLHPLLPRSVANSCFLSLPFLRRTTAPACPRLLVLARGGGERSVSATAKMLSSEFRNASSTTEPDEKLRMLREVFARPGIGIDAYIIPSQDAHQSEFIAECYMRRAYISGFTGSAGTAVVTKDKAALWTDGRYFLQAEKQLSPSWTLMRAGNLGVPTTSEWLNGILSPGSRIGIDPFLFSCDAAEELREAIKGKNHELVLLHELNLVDEVWKESRPKPPNKPIRIHDLKYAGLDVATKLSFLRAEIKEAGASTIVISMLDEVAWLLNVRGSDVPHSPVMYAYLIVKHDSAEFFVDASKVTQEVMDHLKKAGVKLKPYISILSEIGILAKEGANVWLDTSSVNAAIVNTYRSTIDKYFKNRSKKKSRRMLDNGYPGDTENSIGVYRPSPISLAKAVKNDAELLGMRDCHLRDAAALAQFWYWLEQEIAKGMKPTEVEVADKLLEFRTKQAGFLDTSFDTISGSGANGAIIHYKPEPGTCSIVDAEKLFLLDSGAQYVDGTTDITRTVHFGEPTARQKECFTRVLQGHIALDQAIFPEGTPGFVLDAFARSSLWKIGLDYRHGTGHGVGAALNVHEGPQSISFRYGNSTALQKGMIVSNEPGYYEDHAFGIRIENLLVVTEMDTPNCYGGIGYLGFEKLTFFPIQTKMVEQSLMSVADINWLNDYHQHVWEKVSPFLEDDGPARQWLWDNTRPLSLQ